MVNMKAIREIINLVAIFDLTVINIIQFQGI